jgi:hypothetical protein
MKRSMSASKPAMRSAGGGTNTAFARPGAADPVLRPAQCTGLLAGPAHTVEQQAVRVGKQPHADRQALGIAQVVLHQTKGAQVVGHFLHVIRVANGNARLFVEKIGQSRLGALDLGGEQRLLANGAVEKPVHRWNQPRHAGQPGQREFRGSVQLSEGFRGQCGPARGQRVRHECLDGLTQRGGSGVGAGAAHRMKAFLNWRPTY